MTLAAQSALTKTELVAELNGERYFVAPAEAAKAAGGRSWRVTRVSDQEHPLQQVSVPLPSFHEGAGFSYGNVPYVYDSAGAPVSGDGEGAGWDASVPGRITTWARHAVGETATGDLDVQGWLVFHHGYLYLLRGQYATKYVPSDTPGATWEIAETKDFGSGKVVAGRPAQFGGKLYVPIRDTATGDLAVFQELTTVATPPSTDTWTDGPSGKEAAAFTTYRDMLVRATGGNGVATCAVDPKTATNWSDHNTVPFSADEPGTEIVDLLVWDRYLIIRNNRGLWSFNENFDSVNELPDLQSISDTTVAAGGAYANASLLVPHESGLIQWAPGSYRFVGPEQEGALEEVTPALEQVKGVVPYGRTTFVVGRNVAGDRGFVVSLQPGRGGRDPLPHMHFQAANGRFEGACIVRVGSRTYFVTIKTDAEGKNAQPWAWELPRGNQYPANSGVDKKVLNTTFRTPRITIPGREITKTYRSVELWLELEPEEAPAGLEVWACVDEGTPFQLRDGSGDPATLTTAGFHRLFFPKDESAVGTYVYLEFRVPATGTPTAFTIRDTVLRYSARAYTTRVIETVFVLGSGEFEDLTSQRRTWRKQLEDLEALVGPNSKPVPYRSPWGTSGYCTVDGVEYREVVMKPGQTPTHVAAVMLRESRYA